ncbi:MAG TPA: GreA/GreB family elongation factor [Candidatus Acidoferrum sp.]|nr:GreA/GreB family elongation factor [Candidatus Acidoferrum sp.]
MEQATCSPVNKQTLVTKIVEQLTAELGVYFKAARAAHAEATHEQSRAENKYDTRGLEASYLARGQSKQAAEIEASITEFRALSPREFTATDEIDVGALVELGSGRQRNFYLIGPRAGGTEVMHEETEVLVITPQSPLGQQIVGRKQGERVKIQIAGEQSDYKIVSVS